MPELLVELRIPKGQYFDPRHPKTKAVYDAHNLAMPKTQFEDAFERFMDNVRGNDHIYRYYRRVVRLDRVRHTDGRDYLVRYEHLSGYSPAGNAKAFEASENIDTHVEPEITEKIVHVEGEESFTTAPAEKMNEALVYDTPFTEDAVKEAMSTATWIKCAQCSKTVTRMVDLQEHYIEVHKIESKDEMVIGETQDWTNVNTVTLNVRYSNGSSVYNAPSLKHFIHANFDDLWEYGKTARIGIFDKSVEGEMVSQLANMPQEQVEMVMERVKEAKKKQDTSRKRGSS
jgi:hypothetical protein